MPLKIIWRQMDTEDDFGWTNGFIEVWKKIRHSKTF